MNLVVVALSTIIVYTAYKFGKLSQRMDDRRYRNETTIQNHH